MCSSFDAVTTRGRSARAARYCAVHGGIVPSPSVTRTAGAARPHRHGRVGDLTLTLTRAITPQAIKNRRGGSGHQDGGDRRHCPSRRRFCSCGGGAAPFWPGVGGGGRRSASWVSGVGCGVGSGGSGGGGGDGGGRRRGRSSGDGVGGGSGGGRGAGGGVEDNADSGGDSGSGGSGGGEAGNWSDSAHSAPPPPPSPPPPPPPPPPPAPPPPPPGTWPLLHDHSDGASSVRKQRKRMAATFPAGSGCPLPTVVSRAAETRGPKTLFFTLRSYLAEAATVSAAPHLTRLCSCQTRRGGVPTRCGGATGWDQSVTPGAGGGRQ